MSKIMGVECFKEPPKDKVCPHHNKYMSKVCKTCVKWLSLPCAEDPTERVYHCSDVLNTILALENGKFIFQLGAATENMRNIIAKRVTPNSAPPKVKKDFFKLENEKEETTEQLPSPEPIKPKLITSK